MIFHSLCVLKKTGEPIYQQNFSEEFKNIDFTMFSSFFSAILMFSNQVVKKSLDVLDLGELRVFIHDYEGILFIIIADISSSGLLVSERISRIASKFFSFYSAEDCKKSNECIENPALNTKIQEIVDLKDNYSDTHISQIREIFEKETQQGELSAAALISVKGETYYTSLTIEDLHSALQEIEVRTRTKLSQNISPKFIFQTEKKKILAQLLFLPKFHIPVYIVLLFGENTSLGMADFTLDDMISKLKAALE